MNKLLFGTAGIPHSCKGTSSSDGVVRVHELGLSAMELEFVHGVRMKEESALSLGKIAKANEVLLTAHGPFYVNLNAVEPEKKAASEKRVYDTARITALAGGYSVTFHAAYYLKSTPEQTYSITKKALQLVLDKLHQDKNKIWVRPETTGKATQFGSVPELISLSQELDQVLPCVDFAHLYARSIGTVNSFDQFHQVLADIETALGRDAIKNMHIHMSGILHGPKGERNHLILKETKFNWKAVFRALKEFNAAGIVISESPNIEDDASIMKNYYDSL